MPKPYIVQDKYFQKAKSCGYRARSAFKLLEIDEKFRIFRNGQKVLDLGAAPGSFLQVIREKVGEQGKVIGLDLQEIKQLKGVETHSLDITNFEELSKVLGAKKFDIITADLAPNTSGIKGADQYHSVELNFAVLEVAKRYLKPQGKLVTKVLVGEDFARLVKTLKAHFKSVKNFKPQASKKSKSESYLVCGKP